MTDLNLTALETALDALPKRHPGPGGVAGVMKDGKITNRLVGTVLTAHADAFAAQCPMK